MDQKEMTVEDIQAGYDRGDMDIINGVINQTITVKKPEVEEQIQPVEKVDEPTVSQDIESSDTKENPIVQNKPHIDELERERRYQELIEEQRREEKERLLQEVSKREKELVEEKRAREELEERLQRLEQVSTNKDQNPQSANGIQTDDDEYATDYAKETRRIAKEALENVKTKSADDLSKKIKEIETRLLEADKAEKERTIREKRKHAEKKMYSDLEQLQNQYDELKTSKNIIELRKDVEQFRKDLAYITKARDSMELERYIRDYKNGGETKKLADQKGIKPVDDYDKFQKIAEVVDFKRGRKYDPISGKYIDVLNDDGERVTYRSYDEAYKILNYYDTLNQVRKNSYKEIQNKLSQKKDSAVTLDDGQTKSFETGDTIESDEKILNIGVREIRQLQKRKDFKTLDLIKRTYAKYNLEPPKISMH